MQTYKYVVGTTSTSLLSNISDQNPRCQTVLVQAPSTNVDKIYFGSKGSEYHSLIAGDFAGIPVQRLNEMFFIAIDPADEIVVTIFRS